jgi:hypothetical protein
MPYITRDENNHINGLYGCAQFPDQEFLEVAEIWTPVPTYEEFKAKELAAFRAMRLDLLDVLTGIGFRASVTAQPDVAASAAVFQQALLDLPGLQTIADATTAAQLKLAMKNAYNAATAGAHPIVLNEWQKVKP